MNAEPKFYWHIHHEVLFEAATEPIKNRIAYIKAEKPRHEVATRLRLLKPIVGPLPAKASAELSKADAEWSKARAEWSKASAEWSKADAELSKADAELSKARAEWSKARAEWSKAPEILALHAKECPNCPWEAGQGTIFPVGNLADGGNA